MRTGKHKSGQRGLSLVEILVVLALAAMVAGIVVINAPPGRGDARRAAERLAARLDFAAQEAVTSGAVLGLRLGDDGYEFYRYERGEWAPASAAQMNGEVFSPEFSVAIETEQPAKKNEPEERRLETKRETEKTVAPAFRFLPTGETTPAAFLIEDRRERWRVTLDGSGHVDVSDEEGA